MKNKQIKNRPNTQLFIFADKVIPSFNTTFASSQCYTIDLTSDEQLGVHDDLNSLYKIHRRFIGYANVAMLVHNYNEKELIVFLLKAHNFQYYCIRNCVDYVNLDLTKLSLANCEDFGNAANSLVSISHSSLISMSRIGCNTADIKQKLAEPVAQIQKCKDVLYEELRKSFVKNLKCTSH